ncbi:ATP synthase subunit I [soil metagenome]
MNEPHMLIFSCIAGAALGAVFFGGLWWTLRKAMTAPQPALWFMSSALVRMGLTLSGFYFVSAGHWQRLLACLLGFAISRLAITWLTRPRTVPSQKGNHAAQP